MNGCVLPYTQIAVDQWKVKQGNSRIRFFFLSHVQIDKSFTLSSTWSLPIYCSPITKQLLLKRFPVDPSLVHELSLDTPHVIPLTTADNTSMTVTLLDANHCPGAVMFLMEGYFGRILYTGDFRYSGSLMSNSLLQDFLSKPVDSLYLDNTFCSPKCIYPPRDEAVEEVIEIVDKHPTQKILIGLRNLGKEDLLIKIAEKFKVKIGVSEERYHTMEMLEAGEHFEVIPAGSDYSDCRVDAIPLMNITRQNLEILNKTAPTIAIIPTGLFNALGFQPFESSRDIFVVPCSDHSSYAELHEFVKAVRPKTVIPIVKGDPKDPLTMSLQDRTNVECFQEYLDPAPRQNYHIPPSVLELMNQKSGKSSPVVSVKKRNPVRKVVGEEVTPQLLNSQDSKLVTPDLAPGPDVLPRNPAPPTTVPARKSSVGIPLVLRHRNVSPAMMQKAVTAASVAFSKFRYSPSLRCMRPIGVARRIPYNDKFCSLPRSKSRSGTSERLDNELSSKNRLRNIDMARKLKTAGRASYITSEDNILHSNDPLNLFPESANQHYERTNEPVLDLTTNSTVSGELVNVAQVVSTGRPLQEVEAASSLASLANPHTRVNSPKVVAVPGSPVKIIQHPLSGDVVFVTASNDGKTLQPAVIQDVVAAQQLALLRKELVCGNFDMQRLAEANALNSHNSPNSHNATNSETSHKNIKPYSMQESNITLNANTMPNLVVDHHRLLPDAATLSPTKLNQMPQAVQRRQDRISNHIRQELQAQNQQELQSQTRQERQQEIQSQIRRELLSADTQRKILESRYDRPSLLGVVSADWPLPSTNSLFKYSLSAIDNDTPISKAKSAEFMQARLLGKFPSKITDWRPTVPLNTERRMSFSHEITDYVTGSSRSSPALRSSPLVTALSPGVLVNNTELPRGNVIQTDNAIVVCSDSSGLAVDPTSILKVAGMPVVAQFVDERTGKPMLLLENKLPSHSPHISDCNQPTIVNHDNTTVTNVVATKPVTLSPVSNSTNQEQAESVDQRQPSTEMHATTEQNPKKKWRKRYRNNQYDPYQENQFSLSDADQSSASAAVSPEMWGSTSVLRQGDAIGRVFSNKSSQCSDTSMDGMSIDGLQTMPNLRALSSVRRTPLTGANLSNYSTSVLSTGLMDRYSKTTGRSYSHHCSPHRLVPDCHVLNDRHLLSLHGEDGQSNGVKVRVIEGSPPRLRRVYDQSYEVNNRNLSYVKVNNPVIMNTGKLTTDTLPQIPPLIHTSHIISPEDMRDDKRAAPIYHSEVSTRDNRDGLCLRDISLEHIDLTDVTRRIVPVTNLSKSPPTGGDHTLLPKLLPVLCDSDLNECIDGSGHLTGHRSPIDLSLRNNI